VLATLYDRVGDQTSAEQHYRAPPTCADRCFGEQ
jgi:hypothetical protein